MTKEHMKEDTMSQTIERPTSEEHTPYYGTYINLVPTGDIFALLREQIAQVQETVGNLSESDALYRPQPNEWSVKQVIGHLSDCERIMAYRAYSISRDPSIVLPGFEPEEYVREGNYDTRSLDDLLHEWIVLRETTIATFRSLPSDMSQRQAVVVGATMSARAWIYVIVGHVYHHLNSLQSEHLSALR